MLVQLVAETAGKVVPVYAGVVWTPNTVVPSLAALGETEMKAILASLVVPVVKDPLAKVGNFLESNAGNIGTQGARALSKGLSKDSP